MRRVSGHGSFPAGAMTLATAVLLAGCSSASDPSSRSGPTPTDSSASSRPASTESEQTVAVGTTVTLPADMITVSSFSDNVAPNATKPDQSGTHWASAAVQQCATAATRRGKWELALADGSKVAEASSWVEGELADQLQPSDEPLAASYCVSGNVYFFMPDGAEVTGVVLRSSSGAPAHGHVTWTVP